MENENEYAVLLGSIEVRRRGGGGGRTLSGSFPYGQLAVRSDSGRVRKERFAPRAFSFALREKREVHLLSGHTFDKPLASVRAGSLRLSDSAKALSFEATIPAAAEQPTWVRDVVLSIDAGLVGGVSPGFRVAAIEGAEILVPEPGNPGVMIREIREALLFEISLVTRPAYPETTIQRREGETVYPEPNREEETWRYL